jgi:hypothetical protein
MLLSAEAIIAIVGVVITLPGAAFVIWKCSKRNLNSGELYLPAINSHHGAR